MRAQVKHTRVEGERRLVFSSEWLKKNLHVCCDGKMQPFFFSSINYENVTFEKLHSQVYLEPGKNSIVPYAVVFQGIVLRVHHSLYLSVEPLTSHLDHYILKVFLYIKKTDDS